MLEWYGKWKSEYEELIDKDGCNPRSIGVWKPSNFECEYDKSCYVGEYLDCKNCKCKKRLIDKIVEYSSAEDIEETRLVEITSAKNENKHKCSSCTLWVVIFNNFYNKRWNW